MKSADCIHAIILECTMDAGPSKLRITNVRKHNKESLEAMLQSKVRTGGDTSAKFAYIDGAVEVTYANDEVVPRVYSKHRKQKIEVNGIPLELETIPPILDAEEDDDHEIELHNCPDVDPDKIKFYLSAISENQIKNITFNKDDNSKAVAVFSQSLGYELLVRNHRAINDPALGQLIMRPSLRARYLVVTAAQPSSRDDIAVLLESLLREKHGREVETVHIELLDNKKFKAKLPNNDLEDICKILREGGHKISTITGIERYSEHLGTNAHPGIYQRVISLSDLFKQDKLKRDYFVHHLQNQQPFRLLNAPAEMTLDFFGDRICLAVPYGSTDMRAFLLLVNDFENKVDQTLILMRTKVWEKPLSDELFTMAGKEIMDLINEHRVKREIIHNKAGIYIFRVIGNGEHVRALEIKTERIVQNTADSINMRKSLQPYVLETTSPKMLLLGKRCYLDGVKAQYNLAGIEVQRGSNQIKVIGLYPTAFHAYEEIQKFNASIVDIRIEKTQSFITMLQTQSAKETVDSYLCSPAMEMASIYCSGTSFHVVAESEELAETVKGGLSSLFFETNYKIDAEEQATTARSKPEWESTLARLECEFAPLKIQLRKDQVYVCGARTNQTAVLEQIRKFFLQYTQRKQHVPIESERLEFMRTHIKEVLEQLANDVRIEYGDGLLVHGTQEQIERAVAKIKMYRDRIQQSTQQFDGPADIQFIKQSPDILKEIGRQHKALLIIQKDPELMANQHCVKLPNSTICEVQKVDITKLQECDAIVNAANGELKLGGGIAGSINRSVGRSIQKECDEIIQQEGRSLFAGEVRSTNAGNLPFKRIIHAVGPDCCKGVHKDDRTVLYNCMDNVFIEAEKHGLKSVGIPPVSTGIFKYPLKDAVEIIIRVIKDRCTKGSFLPERIILVDINEDGIAAFHREMQAFHAIDVVSCSIQEEVSVDKNVLLGTARDAARPKETPPMPTNTTSVQHSGYTRIGYHSFKYSGVKVNLVSGDLTEQKVDGWVNSIAPDGDLHSNPLGKAILKMAGQNQNELQTLCKRATTFKGPGDVFSTKSWNQTCKKIVHCICPRRWESGGQTKRELTAMIGKCLKSATDCTSVAVPVLGTGKLGFPADEVADATISAIIDYVANHRKSSIRQVNVVVFPKDINNFKAFEDQLQDLEIRSSAGVERGMEAVEEIVSHGTHEIVIKNCRLRIVPGDILDHDSQAIVCSTDHDFNPNASHVSRAYYQKSTEHKTVFADLQSLADKPDDRVVIVDTRGIQNDYTIFASPSSDVTQKISHYIRNILTKSEVIGIQSIAFPTLGAGSSQTAEPDMPKKMVKVIETYMTDGTTSLSNIDIVVFEPELLDVYAAAIQKAKKKGKPRNKIIKFLQRRISGLTKSAAMPAIAGRVPSLRVNFYALNQNSIDGAIKDLKDRISGVRKTLRWSQFRTYAADRELIMGLSESQVEMLTASARERHITLDVVLGSAPDITMTGLNDALPDNISDVRAVLQDVQNRQQMKQEADRIIAQIQWSIQLDDGTWHNFDSNDNKLFEDHHKVNPNATFTLERDGDQLNAQVQLSDTGRSYIMYGNEKHSVRRHDRLKAIGEYWEPPLDKTDTYLVGRHTLEYAAQAQLFLSSINKRFTNQPSGFTVDKVNIMQITRIQNTTLYGLYDQSLNHAARRLGWPMKRIERWPVWHGTAEANVKKIVMGEANSFNRTYAASNVAAIYGQGNYFAAYSGYSAHPRFAAPNDDGVQTIIQCRIIAGESCKGKPEYTEPPLKDGSSTEKYDSCVDKTEDPGIFVVFPDTYNYPEYIIKFKIQQ